MDNGCEHDSKSVIAVCFTLGVSLVTVVAIYTFTVC